MLLLSKVTGRKVRLPDGRALGRLVDVTARLGERGDLTKVHRLVISQGEKSYALVPWDSVESLTHKGVRVLSDRADSTVDAVDDALDPKEVLLVRDVLDTQIVDIAGQRMARVADVVLAHRRDHTIEVVGVDVGFGAVLRRLGLGRLAGHVTADVVPWTDLHLTSERGHAVALATPRSAVNLLDARGLATLIARLDTDSAAEVLTAKGPEIAAEVISTGSPAVGERVLRAMTEVEAAGVLAAMPVRHATHWHRLLAGPRYLRQRHFLRFRVWPRRRHPPTEGG